MSISHDELKRLYAANQQSKNDFHERLANAAWERMSPFDKQRLGVQRIKLYEFLDLMGEIFGDKLPILIPTAVNLEECTRIPIVKWKSITQNIQGEERIVWMRKLEQAVCGGGCVQIRLGSHSYNLCLLDIDHDDLVEPLLQANPILQTTLQTYGSKGRHIWFFAEGDYPVKKKRILCDEKVLELLTENSLCTIWGTHYKTGQQYQMIHKATPILFNLDNLKLPAGFAWESKVSSNGQRKGTFTGGFRASGSS